MAGRVKKYIQKPISPKFSEKGGYSARFIGEGFSVDGQKEILPKVIEKEGLKIGKDPGWSLIKEFIKACADHTAATGETVNVANLMTFTLAIKGWFEKKTDKAKPENVRVTCRLLNELRPTCVFSMSNANEGNTLRCSTATTPGCTLNHVRQAAAVTINGSWLKMIADGTDVDNVYAEATPAGGEVVRAQCAITGSDDDHVNVMMPAEFNGESFVGRPIKFVVTGRCGDPDAGTQTDSVEATLDAGEIPPAPTVTLGPVKTGSVAGKIVLDEDEFQIGGEHLEKIEGDTLKVKGLSDQGAPVEYVIPPATFTCDEGGEQLRVQITEAMRDAFYSGWTWDEVTLEYTSHAGVPGSAAQVTTCTAEVTNE